MDNVDIKYVIMSDHHPIVIHVSFACFRVAVGGGQCHTNIINWDDLSAEQIATYRSDSGITLGEVELIMICSCVIIPNAKTLRILLQLPGCMKGLSVP